MKRAVRLCKRVESEEEPGIDGLEGSVHVGRTAAMSRGDITVEG